MGLALTMRPEERIFIGDDIAIVLGESDGNQVRIVIEAPKEKKILREKIADDDTRASILAKTFLKKKQL